MLASKEDLTPGTFPTSLNWSEQQARDSLEKLYQYANTECERAIKWYYDKKRSKRIAGYTCRVGAIFTTTLAGVIPILGEVAKTDEFIPQFSPAWATVAIALTAVLIALDRLGGYTSGWIRYIRSGQLLTELQSDFVIEWEKLRLDIQVSSADLAVVKQGIELCRQYLARVHSIVRAETDQWAREFQKALDELEKNAKK